MKPKFFIRAVVAIIFMALIYVFHTPYSTPLTDWREHDGQKYRAELWHSNTPLATDRLRLALRDKNGALRAASPDGFMRSVDCPNVGKCIIYFYTHETASDVYPLESWILDWPAATASAAAVTDDFNAPPSGFSTHTRANDYITGNICHTNILTSILLYLSAQFFALLLVTGMRAQLFWRKYYLALLVALPACAGITGVIWSGIVTYERMLIATAGMSLACAPIWAVCSLYHSILLRNPQKKLKPRAIAYVFLAVFCLSAPFIQQAMQGRSWTGAPLEDQKIILDDLKMDPAPLP